MDTSEPPKRPKLSITAHETPHHLDPPNARDFYEALGKTIIAWGRLEGHLYGCLLIIKASLRWPKKIPLQWKQRADLWNAGFATIPELLVHQEHAAMFIKRLVEEAEDRNYLAHGIWGEFTPDEAEPTIKMTSLNQTDGDTLQVHDVVWRLSMIRSVLHTANDLNFQMVAFYETLKPLQGPEPL